MLQGKKILLRCVKEEDLKELYSNLLPIWKKGSLFSEHRFRLQFFETSLWTEEMGLLLILKEEAQIGAIWYEKLEALNSLTLHFALFGEENQGKGYMKEAVPLFCRYLFSTKRVDRLQLFIPNYNHKAIHLARACRFQFEGIARKAIYMDGESRDLCFFSLLRAEFKEIEKIGS